MSLLLGISLSLVAPVATAAPELDWWWVAGDSRDSEAVFVDGGSVRRDGDAASIAAVRIARDGSAADASWRGKCSDRHADDQIAAIARFACGDEAERMRNAAILPGLTPNEAARAIFSVRVPKAPQSPIQG